MAPHFAGRCHRISGNRLSPATARTSLATAPSTSGDVVAAIAGPRSKATLGFRTTTSPGLMNRSIPPTALTAARTMASMSWPWAMPNRGAPAGNSTP